MNIWAISDLHLSFGVSNKQMEVFGTKWINHTQKIEKSWKDCVSTKDLVLIAGDISWAINLNEVKPDLDWIDRLPGTKVIIKGNHDYWWSSLKKINNMLPPSIHLIQNNALSFENVSIGGARLWDSNEYHFNDLENNDEAIRSKIFQRELCRLELSLKQLSSKSNIRIAMTHFPPIGHDLSASETSILLEKFNIDICVFGHLHNHTQPFGKKNNINYILTSCDVIDFTPTKII